MFVNLHDMTVVGYEDIKRDASLGRVGWPSDPMVSGIDEIISGKYSRVIATPPPDVSPIQVAFQDGVFEDDGVYYQKWALRNKTVEEKVAEAAIVKASYEFAVQNHLDAKAKELQFDSIHTAVTYADEPSVPRFQADGIALRAWRSLVWAAVYQALDDVMAGQRPQPTVDELIEELPAFTPA